MLGAEIFEYAVFFQHFEYQIQLMIARRMLQKEMEEDLTAPESAIFFPTLGLAHLHMSGYLLQENCLLLPLPWFHCLSCLSGIPGFAQT